MHIYLFWVKYEGEKVFFDLINMHTYSPSGTVTSFGNLLEDEDKTVSLTRFSLAFTHSPKVICTPKLRELAQKLEAGSSNLYFQLWSNPVLSEIILPSFLTHRKEGL